MKDLTSECHHLCDNAVGMAPKMLQSATRGQNAGPRSPTVRIRQSSKLFILQWTVAVHEAMGWKDEGHMLTAAVAREFMKASTVAKVEATLQTWSSYYPSTSTLETAAVWMDHIHCEHPGDYCDFQRQDAYQLFDKWHYCSVPWNPQNIPLRPIDVVKPLPSVGADWALRTLYDSLKQCTGDKRPKQSTPPSGRAAEEKAKIMPGRRNVNALSMEGGASAVTLEEGHGRQQSLSEFATASEIQNDERLQYPRAATADSQKDGQWMELSGHYPTPATAYSPSEGAAQEVEAQEKQSSSQGEVEDDNDNFACAQSSSGLEARKESPALSPGVCSIMSYNLFLRQLIHIMGDVHQPLHAAAVYSVVFPHGDAGGNSVPVHLPDLKEGLTTASSPPGSAHSHNLHDVWDSGFFQYPKPYNEIDMKALRKEAKRLVQKYPVAKRAAKTFCAFGGIIRESHKLVRNFVYSEFEWTKFTKDFLPYTPSKQYIVKAREVVEQRITLGGARLGFLLESISENLPSGIAVIQPAVSAWSPLRSAERPLQLEAEGSDIALMEADIETVESTTPRQTTRKSRGQKVTTSANYRNSSEDTNGDSDGVGTDWPPSKKSGAGVQRPSEHVGHERVLLGLSLPTVFYVVLLLSLILVGALLMAWKQVRLYRRALQAVIRCGGVAADISGRAAAASQAGDWRGAAALLAEYDEHLQQQKEPLTCMAEAASEASTVYGDSGASRPAAPLPVDF